MKNLSCKMILTVCVVYLLPILFGIGVFVLCYQIEISHVPNTETLVKFYQEKMRGSLFAGFLTLGSFLLSLKTGIVIKIKESLFDKQEYQEKVEKAQAGNQGIKSTIYGPLRRMSRVMSAAVLSALLASAIQLTLGLYSTWWAAAMCLSMATIALLYLLEAFVLIQMNLSIWFEFLDEDAERKRDKRAIEEKGAINKDG